MMGDTGTTALVALRGEIGIPEIKIRLIEGRLKYLNNIEHRGHDLLRAIKNQIMESGRMMLGRRNAAYLTEGNLNWAQVNNMTSEAVKRRVGEVRHNRWREEMQPNSPLTVYRS